MQYGKSDFDYLNWGMCLQYSYSKGFADINSFSLHATELGSIHICGQNHTDSMLEQELVYNSNLLTYFLSHCCVHEHSGNAVYFT